jgi:predicted metal-dependent hydrolase
MLRLFRRDPSLDTTPDHLDVVHEGATYRVLLKRAPTARRFTLRVRNATRDVVMTMPKRSSIASAKDFAQRHAAWIAARLHRLPQAVPFAHGSRFPLRGEDVTIEHIDQLRGGIEIVSEQKILRVSCSHNHLARRIHDYLKTEARKELETAVKLHCTTLGFASRKVTVRDTTSRWGSCSASGALNFSWRLIMAPPFVLDYLAAHEVAHLIHMNHSDEFWSVTKKLAPQTDRAEAWLYAHGSLLHRYGAER